MNLAGSSKLLRALNSSAALALLLERGRLTRGELREATGLSKPTVSDALRRLVEADLAVVVGHVVGGPGPNAEIYAVNAEAAHVAAVSVRESADRPWVTASLCDLTGAVRAQLERPADLDRRDPVSVVAETVNELTTSARTRNLAQVHLGVAGSVDPTSHTIRYVDLPGFDRPGLVSEVGERLGVPFDVDNDVNLATVAERRHGCGAGTDGFALLWLGEGVGLGIDLGGSLLRGARGSAGEIGYIPLRAPTGEAAGCDEVNDLQDLVGGDAVRSLARTFGRSGPTAAEAIASAIVDDGFRTTYAGRVAVAVAAVVAVLDPALVVLAGPVSVAGGEPLRKAVADALGRAAPLTTVVRLTAVRGDPVLLGGLDAALRAVRARLVSDLRDSAR